MEVEHFRDEDKVFVFRSPTRVEVGQDLDDTDLVERLTKLLLAYEAAFRELGDMVPEEG